MARCGCGSSCTCLFEDSDSLIITGNGDSTNGYQGELRIDPASPTAVTISAAGISVASVGGGGGGLTDGDKGDRRGRCRPGFRATCGYRWRGCSGRGG